MGTANSNMCGSSSNGSSSNSSSSNNSSNGSSSNNSRNGSSSNSSNNSSSSRSCALVLVFLTTLLHCPTFTTQQTVSGSAITQLGRVFIPQSPPPPYNLDLDDYILLLNSTRVTTPCVVYGVSMYLVNTGRIQVILLREQQRTTPPSQAINPTATPPASGATSTPAPPPSGGGGVSVGVSEGTGVYDVVERWYLGTSDDTDMPREDMVWFKEERESCVQALPGDVFGVRYSEDPAPIAFNLVSLSSSTMYISTTAHRSNSDGPISIGDLPYPWQVSLAIFTDNDVARYDDLDDPDCRDGLPFPSSVLERPTPTTDPPRGDTEPQGPTGPQGPEGSRGEKGSRGRSGPTGQAGPDGATGAQGATGVQGEKGSKGDIGPQGVRGPTGPVATVSASYAKASRLESEVGDCDWCWELYNPYILLGALIWLLIVTVTLLVLVCIVTCRRRKARPAGATLVPPTPHATDTGFEPHYDRTLSWENPQKEMWDSMNGGAGGVHPHTATEMEEDAQSKTGYDNPAAGEEIYSCIREGRTAF